MRMKFLHTLGLFALMSTAAVYAQETVVTYEGLADLSKAQAYNGSENPYRAKYQYKQTLKISNSIEASKIIGEEVLLDNDPYHGMPGTPYCYTLYVFNVGEATIELKNAKTNKVVGSVTGTLEATYSNYREADGKCDPKALEGSVELTVSLKSSEGRFLVGVNIPQDSTFETAGVRLTSTGNFSDSKLLRFELENSVKKDVYWTVFKTASQDQYGEEFRGSLEVSRK
jgi:archaellum component FlaG (FlaF/FlaG flagellin family)